MLNPILDALTKQPEKRFAYRKRLEAEVSFIICMALEGLKEQQEDTEYKSWLNINSALDKQYDSGSDWPYDRRHKKFLEVRAKPREVKEGSETSIEIDVRTTRPSNEQREFTIVFRGDELEDQLDANKIEVVAAQHQNNRILFGNYNERKLYASTEALEEINKYDQLYLRHRGQYEFGGIGLVREEDGREVLIDFVLPRLDKILFFESSSIDLIVIPFHKDQALRAIAESNSLYMETYADGRLRIVSDTPDFSFIIASDPQWSEVRELLSKLTIIHLPESIAEVRRLIENKGNIDFNLDWDLIVLDYATAITMAYKNRINEKARRQNASCSFHLHYHPTNVKGPVRNLVVGLLEPSQGDMDLYVGEGYVWANIRIIDDLGGGPKVHEMLYHVPLILSDLQSRLLKLPFADNSVMKELYEKTKNAYTFWDEIIETYNQTQDLYPDLVKSICRKLAELDARATLSMAKDRLENPMELIKNNPILALNSLYLESIELEEKLKNTTKAEDITLEVENFLLFLRMTAVLSDEPQPATPAPAGGEGQVEMFAHRGCFSNEIPENSIPAFEKAVEMGLDGFELDAYATKDKVVMISHHEPLENLTNGKGHIPDYTYDECRKFQLRKRRHSNEFTKLTLPTLQEVFDVVKNSVAKIQIHIEDINSVDAVLKTITENNFVNRVTISSMGYHKGNNTKCAFEILTKVREKNKQVKTALIFSPGSDRFPCDKKNTRKLLKEAKNADVSIFDLSLRDQPDLLTREIVQLIHEEGIKIAAGFQVANTVLLRKVIDLGVDRIISESPETMMETKKIIEYEPAAPAPAGGREVDRKIVQREEALGRLKALADLPKEDWPRMHRPPKRKRKQPALSILDAFNERYELYDLATQIKVKSEVIRDSHINLGGRDDRLFTSVGENILVITEDIGTDVMFSKECEDCTGCAFRGKKADDSYVHGFFHIFPFRDDRLYRKENIEYLAEKIKSYVDTIECAFAIYKEKEVEYLRNIFENKGLAIIVNDKLSTSKLSGVYATGDGTILRLMRAHENYDSINLWSGIEPTPQPATPAPAGGKGQAVEYDKAEFEAYLKKEGLSGYKKLKECFSPEVIKALLEDPALRPVFMQVLPNKAVGTLEICDEETLNKIGGAELLLDHSAFSVGSPKAAEEVLGKKFFGKRGKIIVGVTDRWSEDTLHEKQKVANGRQAYFPLFDGTWLGIKGAGQFRDETKPPAYVDRSQRFIPAPGLAWEKEAMAAKEGIDLIKERYGKRKGRFVELLGYRHVNYLPDGGGRLKTTKGLKVPERNLSNTVLIFNRFISPHRAVKFPQLLKTDPGLRNLSHRISRALVNNGYLPQGKELSPSEMITMMMAEIGYEEAVKQNIGRHKHGINCQDITFGGEETDNEEFCRAEELKERFSSKSFKECASILEQYGLNMQAVGYKVLTLIDMIKAVRTIRVDGEIDLKAELFPEPLENLKAFFRTYFNTLDDHWLELWIGKRTRGHLLRFLYNMCKYSSLGFLHPEFWDSGGSPDMFANEIIEKINSWAEEEKARRKKARARTDKLANATRLTDISTTKMHNFIAGMSPLLKGSSVDMYIKNYLSLIPEADLDRNMKTWAYLIALSNTYGLDVNYIFELKEGKVDDDVMDTLLLHLRKIASEKHISLDSLTQRINKKHDDPKTIKVHIMDVEKLKKMRTLDKDVLPVAMLKGQDGMLLDFAAAHASGIAQAVCKKLEREKDQSLEEVIENKILPVMKKIYERLFPNEKIKELVTKQTILNMIDDNPMVRKNLAIELALPPMRIAIEQYFENLELLLQYA
jgi:glycerophosphoryl diester phosphodiesterase